MWGGDFWKGDDVMIWGILLVLEETSLCATAFRGHHGRNRGLLRFVTLCRESALFDVPSSNHLECWGK